MSLPELIPSDLPVFVRKSSRTDFTNSVVPEGAALLFAQSDSYSGVRFITKNSDGTYTEVGGGSIQEPVVGYAVNVDGNLFFHSLGSDSMSESISSLKIVNTGVDEPAYQGGSSGGESFYKCASVDTTNEEWSGYLASIDSTTGIWSFASTATTGLSYNTFPPVVGCIYDQNGTFACSLTIPKDQSIIFYAPMKLESNTTPTGQVLTDVSPDPTYIPQGAGSYTRTMKYTNFKEKALFSSCIFTGLSEFSVMFRVCPKLEHASYIISEATVNDYFRILIAYYRTGNKFTFGTRNVTSGDTGTRNDLHSQSDLALDQWYDICCTYSSTAKKIYINGTLDASGSGGSAMTNSSNCFLIGDGTQYTGTEISDILIFNRELSADEINVYLNR